jgi:hypothetical protein
MTADPAVHTQTPLGRCLPLFGSVLGFAVSLQTRSFVLCTRKLPLPPQTLGAVSLQAFTPNHHHVHPSFLERNHRRVLFPIFCTILFVFVPASRVWE